METLHINGTFPVAEAHRQLIAGLSPHILKDAVILVLMDHLEVLREKIARLRSEIADIRQQNQAYRLHRANGTEAQVAHGQRHERLQEIQEELLQLSNLSQKVLSLEQMREKHRSHLHLDKQAS